MHFKVSRIQLFSALLALVLVVGFAGLSLARSPEAASAASGHQADVTFTKWLTNTSAFPWDMVGVVGGDVGNGTFTGEVLNKFGDGTHSAIHTLYHFNVGKKQSFTAELFVTQTDATGAGVVTLGVVTSGWLKGSRVTGGFELLPVCDMPTPSNVAGTLCFKGALHVGPKY